MAHDHRGRGCEWRSISSRRLTSPGRVSCKWYHRGNLIGCHRSKLIYKTADLSQVFFKSTLSIGIVNLKPLLPGRESPVPCRPQSPSLSHLMTNDPTRRSSGAETRGASTGRSDRGGGTRPLQLGTARRGHDREGLWRERLDNLRPGGFHCRFPVPRNPGKTIKRIGNWDRHGGTDAVC